jgi:hypothetical protein
VRVTVDMFEHVNMKTRTGHTLEPSRKFCPDLADGNRFENLEMRSQANAFLRLITACRGCFRSESKVGNDRGTHWAGVIESQPNNNFYYLL